MIEGEWYLPVRPLFGVRVCINKRLNTDKLPNCAGRGSRELADRLERRLTEARIPAEVIRGPCMNNCAIGPNIKIQAGPLFNLQGDVSDARVDEIIAAVKAEVERRQAAADTDAASP